MARIRTIKPDFWTDEKVVALSPLARLLFIGMWNFVDDEGRAEFSPMRLKMQILPADAADISELLGEIRREKMILVYEVDGKEYFEVCGFTKHQKVDKRAPSKHPAPPPPAEFPRVVPTEGKGREGKGKGKEGGAGAPEGYVFEGRVIRLTAKDLDRWRQSYFCVPDVEASLRAADAYYVDNPPPNGKWFFAASNWLKREHDKLLAERDRGKRTEDEAYRGAL